jgi:hypothetical protein
MLIHALMLLWFDMYVCLQEYLLFDLSDLRPQSHRDMPSL